MRAILKTVFEGPRFERDQSRTRAGQVIYWWESRRLFFNLVVGCAGVITCVLMILCALFAESTVGEPIGLPDGPLLGVFGIFFYGMLANVFYTGGWICELLLRTSTTAERSAAFGLKAFRFGLTLSMFITLCPAVLCWITFLILLVSGQKHTFTGE